MLNLSGINNNSLIGRMLRLPLKLIPKNAVIPVMQGTLKGMKWIAGSGTHGYWLGSYEIEFRKKFESYIKKGFMIYDLGANAGFYSLLASVLTGETGNVFAFEPVKKNLEYLYKHIELNNLENIKVIPKAVSDIDGKLKFNLGSNNFTGRIDEQGDIEVDSVKLDSFIKVNSVPDIIKMDIEGGEYKALLGAAELLKNYKPLIFLSTHSRDVHNLCLKLLQDFGYECNPSNGDTIIATKNQK